MLSKREFSYLFILYGFLILHHQPAVSINLCFFTNSFKFLNLVNNFKLCQLENFTSNLQSKNVKVEVGLFLIANLMLKNS